MRKTIIFTYIMALLIWNTEALSQVTSVISEKRHTRYVPNKKECKKNDTCDLKGVTFRVQLEHVHLEGDATRDQYGTDMYASYETNTLEKVKKYVFVQFIRGCVFHSEMLPTGEIANYFTESRDGYMDTPYGYTLFRHPNWEIDSIDEDPVYASNPDFAENRHYLYQWIDPAPSWIPEKQGNLYGEKPPKFPRLFIVDHTVSAGLFWNIPTKNTSLEFRTCLYKTVDVPRKRERGDINFATPVTCFEWSHNFVYNHGIKDWERPTTIAEVCHRPLNALEIRQEELRRRWFIDHP